jgi:hypothetical protein
MWSIIHHAVAVNAWRARIFPGIPNRYICCTLNVPETILHRFYACPKVRVAWDYAMTLLHCHLKIPQVNHSWPGFTWQQCILGSTLPRCLAQGQHLWSLTRGTVLWAAWKDRNSLTFENKPWTIPLIEQTIWDRIQEHGRTEWQRTLELIDLFPARTHRWLSRFDNCWCLSDTFVTRQDRQVLWSHARPHRGVFS